ncbi:TatD family hydrolase [Methylobacterium isbiliense]|jgi:TatD DNase family protein|uniref:Metal-dependent hydrolase YcfH n=1 Tax=Methylobacterium isbiliense TaxID=315478 RepID=A0ABQ4SJS6_9HYPH|nr:TatD family hydrolase [Methylobacterium isbiliense]MDN3625906.1 TatD family hydrolase [Methylobacterium isbiliense]GJE02581.1 putative metal-dependent hydrolase YcfH [Methylobacterium isbiliense]
MLVDSHCHLDFPGLSERLPEVLARARAAGVTRMLTISTRVRQAAVYRGLAEAHPEILFTVGTHPHQAAEEPDVPAAEIAALSRHPRCVGIGEAGLDYHYDKAPRDVQARVFRTHIAAARETGLPLVIHARDADDDMAAILTEEMARGRFRAVLHCFSSGRRLAEIGVELGLYVSFSGILTFRRSEELRAIAASLPRDRLLVETDAPYLAPEPHRGKPNEPAYVARTAAVLAGTLGMTPDDLARLTTANFFALFDKALRAQPAGADAAHADAAHAGCAHPEAPIA